MSNSRRRERIECSVLAPCVVVVVAGGGGAYLAAICCSKSCRSVKS
jgi:hypothetical protein